MPADARPVPSRAPGGAPTPLRPATYAGLAAAVMSVTAAIVIRVAPASEPIVVGLHLLVTATLYLMGGALAARLGGDGWRAGLFAGLLDALVGHAIAFLISEPPDPSRVTLPRGMEPTPQVLAGVHLWGAVLGAAMAVAIGVAAGAAGGWYARRTGVAGAASTGTGR